MSIAVLTLFRHAVVLDSCPDNPLNSKPANWVLDEWALAYER